MSNQQIIRALKACKPYLAHNFEENRCAMKTTYVCNAIGDAQRAGDIRVKDKELAKAYINRMLEDQASAVGWLCKYGYIDPNLDHQTFTNYMQEWRFRWVDHMIQELSK